MFTHAFLAALFAISNGRAVPDLIGLDKNGYIDNDLPLHFSRA
jgi:hypothetical protein